MIGPVKFIEVQHQPLGPKTAASTWIDYLGILGGICFILSRMILRPIVRSINQNIYQATLSQEFEDEINEATLANNSKVDENINLDLDGHQLRKNIKDRLMLALDIRQLFNKESELTVEPEDGD